MHFWVSLRKHLYFLWYYNAHSGRPRNNWGSNPEVRLNPQMGVGISISPRGLAAWYRARSQDAPEIQNCRTFPSFNAQTAQVASYHSQCIYGTPSFFQKWGTPGLSRCAPVCSNFVLCFPRKKDRICPIVWTRVQRTAVTKVDGVDEARAAPWWIVVAPVSGRRVVGRQRW